MRVHLRKPQTRSTAIAVWILVSCAIPANAQESGTPDTTPVPDATPVPEATKSVVPQDLDRLWPPGPRMSHLLLSASLPGTGQLFQRRWLWGGLQLGSASALFGLIVLGGSVDSAPIKWLGLAGLAGLSLYSPLDAYWNFPLDASPSSDVAEAGP